MTREQAIKWLKDMLKCFDLPMEQYQIALEMAIKALEQEPSGDLISKKSVKNAIYKVCLSEGNKDIFVKILDEINKLPSIKQEPCEDAISRQAVLNACMQSINISEAVDRIMDLPSINQEPKTGHWIEHDWEDMREKGYYRCSVCGTGYQRFVKGIRKSDVPYIDGQEYTLHNIDNYCPNCGCAMKGESE